MADRPHLYILDEQGEPQAVEDVLEWGRWTEAHRQERIIKKDYFDNPFPPTDDQIGVDVRCGVDPYADPLPTDPMQRNLVRLWDSYKRRQRETIDLEAAVTKKDLRICVSTVFLGLDHSFSFGLHAPPILFETMVFGGPFSGDQDRYATRTEALAGHEAMCARVRAAIEKETR